MPRARISEPSRRSADPVAGISAPVEVVADEAELDARLGVYTLFFAVPRFETVYFRVVIESWEDGAFPRTVERFLEGDSTRSLVVVMVVPDFVEASVRRLARLCAEMEGAQVRTTHALREKLRRDLWDDEPAMEAED